MLKLYKFVWIDKDTWQIQCTAVWCSQVQQIHWRMTSENEGLILHKKQRKKEREKK